MWSAVGVVFDCASKRSITGRMRGRGIDGERRRGIDSEITGASIVHLEGLIFFEMEGAVPGRKQAVIVVMQMLAARSHTPLDHSDLHAFNFLHHERRRHEHAIAGHDRARRAVGGSTASAEGYHT